MSTPAKDYTLAELMIVAGAEAFDRERPIGDGRTGRVPAGHRALLPPRGAADRGAASSHRDRARARPRRRARAGARPCARRDRAHRS